VQENDLLDAVSYIGFVHLIGFSAHEEALVQHLNLSVYGILVVPSWQACWLGKNPHRQLA
jgi:hypothetical protein